MTSHHSAGAVEAARVETGSVTAVIVAHNGARWLPQLFSSLESTTRFPDQLVAVDTGSTDATGALLAEAFGPSAVHTVDRSLGFGAAVQAGLTATDDTADPDGWIWLLHDDCAPAPDALEQLLRVGRSEPGICVVGGRVRAWPRARRLLEVGVTMTGTGHRETGVEIGEYDQGQHDAQRDVLSVSSAGMLVRRRTWHELGGFERRLPLFGDDVDFGWRVAKAGGRVVVAPGAVIFHAEAATRGVRSLDDLRHVPNSPHRAERQGAIFTLLANCRGLVFPVQYVRLFLGSILRAVGYLIGKLPRAAADEVLAMLSVLGRPLQIIGARARRRRTSSASHRSVRSLLPPWWTPYLNALDSLLSRFADTVRDTAAQVASAARLRRSGTAGLHAVESGPVPDEAVNLPTGGGPVAWVVGHPVLSLSGLLTLAGVLTTRDLWGGGWLQGGALLPAPASSSAWWSTYTESWHHVGLGSLEAPSPYIAILAIWSMLVLGKSWLAVQLIVVLAVPLSAVGAYVAARRLVESLGTRVWMSVSYALLPVLTGSVSTGHIGTTVAVILLPWLFRAAMPMSTTSRTQSTGAWRSVFASGIVLSVVVAFAPVAWPMAIVVAALAIGWLLLMQERRAGVLARPAVAALLPAALLLPWSWRLLTTPSLFLTEAGRVDSGTPAVSDHAWLVPFGRVAVSGDAPWWLSVGVVLAALAALLRKDRRGRILTAWAIVLVGLASTAVLAACVVTVPGTREETFPWVGFPVVVAQGAALVAAGLAADGVGRVIQTGTFGWRQPLAAATALVALVGPLAGLVWWIGDAPQGSLDRQQAVPLPAYMVDAMQADGQRVLVVNAIAGRSGDSTSDSYTVLAGDGTRLGDDSVIPPPNAELTRLVTGLLSEATTADVERLAELGIVYVVLPAPYDTDQIAQLDGVPELSRASTNPHRVAGWHVDVPLGPVQLVDSSGASHADPGGHRVLWLVAQGLLVVVAVVLAAPAVQRSRHGEEDLT
jgi:GT2 family glycosyltransferase